MEDEISQIRKLLGLSQEDGVAKDAKSGELRQKRSAVKSLCPENPSGLLGQIFVNQQDVPELEQNSADFEDWFGPDIRPGGAWKPRDCEARQKVVILVSILFWNGSEQTADDLLLLTGALPRPFLAAVGVSAPPSPCAAEAAAGLPGRGGGAELRRGLQPSSPDERRLQRDRQELWGRRLLGVSRR